MFVIALLVTGLLVASVAGAIHRQDRSTFDNEVARTLDAFDQRIRTTTSLLRGTVGLFAASSDVDAREFRAYVGTLHLRERYPGILGIGFTRHIPSTELARYEARARADGMPGFRVWPGHPRDEYHSIVFLEPMDERNSAAIGYDMYTDPVRREAMGAARERGDVVASGKVTLVQEIDEHKQSGFLMYMPVRAASGSEQAVASRPLLGFVYSPLRADDLLQGARGSGTPLIDYEVFDGIDPDPGALLRSTMAAPPQTPRFSADRVIDVAGRPWLVRFHSRAEQGALSQWWLVPWLALAAFATSLLLARLSWSQVSARSAAEVAAREQRDWADALHQEREWLRATLIGIADGVVVVDASERVVLMNPVAEHLTGWSHADAEGRTIDEVVRVSVPSDDGLDHGSLLGSHANGEVVLGEVMLHEREGLIRPVDHSSAPILDPSGAVAGAVVVMRDATERHRVEAELRGNDRRKDEFLAILAHELRNPLAPICNSLELLRRQPGTEIAERARAVAERQARLMVRLVDDLLDVSRISRGAIVLQRQRLTLATVLETAAESSRPLIDGRRHHFRIGPIDPALLVEGDGARLAQVFTNLLNNAATYTEPGGEIDVAAWRDGDWIAISVRDNGIGIDPANFPHLFDMFVQAEPSLERSGGLGIGLTLVRQLLQMHGGSVEVKSAGAGTGSEFVVRLPLSAPAADDADRGQMPPPEQAGVEADAPAQSLRIMVVDDNPDTANSLAMMLRLDGHRVDVAYDGAAALTMAQAMVPDVALLDIGLPGMNGYDVARHLRAARGDELTLIAITGWGQEDDRSRAYAAGFDHHMIKPIKPAALGALLCFVD